MDDLEYRNVYQSELEHFYYLSVHRLVFTLIEKFLLKRDSITNVSLSILDAGCGTGGLAGRLKSLGHVTGVDVHDEAIRFSRLRGVDCVKSSICAMPFGSDSFDLITCIDVICQSAVEDDLLSLREIARVLKPDGLFVMRVPARPELFSSHDELVMSRKRFCLSEVSEMLVAAGFEPLQLTYCHFPFYLPVLLKTTFEKLRGYSPHSAVSPTNPLLNKCFQLLLSFETGMIKMGLNMPIGMGLVAVARKSSN